MQPGCHAQCLEGLQQRARTRRPAALQVSTLPVGLPACGASCPLRLNISNAQVGAVIVTKLDGHAKGGGALSAVAATRSPIIFIGTGEHMNEFERFEAKSFISRILNKGDWGSFVNTIQVRAQGAHGCACLSSRAQPCPPVTLCVPPLLLQGCWLHEDEIGSAAMHSGTCTWLGDCGHHGWAIVGAQRPADASGLLQDAVPEEARQEELMKDIAKGNFTLRILYDQLANIQKLGPMGQVMSMIPGLNNSGLFSGVWPPGRLPRWAPLAPAPGASLPSVCLARSRPAWPSGWWSGLCSMSGSADAPVRQPRDGPEQALPAQDNEKQSSQRVKMFQCIMDSMTDKELDSTNPKLMEAPSRIQRIARGSGRHPQEVVMLLGAPTVSRPLPAVCAHKAQGSQPGQACAAAAAAALVPVTSGRVSAGSSGFVLRLGRGAEEYKRVRTMLVGAGKGQKGMMQNMKGAKGGLGNMNPHNTQMNAAQMARMLPPQAGAQSYCCLGQCRRRRTDCAAAPGWRPPGMRLTA